MGLITRGNYLNGKRLIATLLIVGVSLLTLAWLDPYRDAVTKGNEEFGRKKYRDAKQYYRKAREYAPGDNEQKKLAFNEGDADYMLGDYEAAASGFQRSLQADERDVQKKALFNTGNVFLKQEKYKEAIEAYMNALKIDPRYEAPKKNIEYLLRMKNEREKQKDNKGEGDGKKNKGNDGQDKKKNNGNKNDRSGEAKRNNLSGMNQEQIKSILKSMQQNPVQRRKGNSNERRRLEKFW